MGTLSQLFETGQHASLKGHFQNLVLLARTDGQIDAVEQKLLHRIAEKLSLTAEEVKSICDDEDCYPILPPVSKQERFERFIQLIQMVFVDGIVTKEEKQLTLKYGIELGLSVHTVESDFHGILEKMKNGADKETILDSLLR
jgi:hypothetical protein